MYVGRPSAAPAAAVAPGEVAGRRARQGLVAELDGLRGRDGDDPVLERVGRVRRLGLDVEIALQAELGGQPVGPDQRRAPHRQPLHRAAPPAGSRRTASSVRGPASTRSRDTGSDSSQPTSSGPKQRSHANSASSGYVAPQPLQARWLAFMVDPLRSGRRRSARPVHIVRDRRIPPDLAPFPAVTAGMVAEASQGRSLRLSGCDAGDRPGGYANCWPHGRRRPPRAATTNRWKIAAARARLVDMFANPHIHQELQRERARPSSPPRRGMPT